MRVAKSWVLCACTVWVLCLRVGPARADAVPPPPNDCPAGQVGVTSHRGPACVTEAPSNCAPGYHGRTGGTCYLAICSTDKECEAGERCLQVDTCQEFRELNWDGWRWQSQPVSVPGGTVGRVPTPTAAPDGPPPKAWLKLSICGQDGPCNAPAECRPAALCFPSKALGQTKAKVVVAPPTPEQLPENVSPWSLLPPDRPPPKSSTTDSHRGGGGCRSGCAVANTNEAAPWLLLLAPLLGAGLWRRRARRP
ncbi:MAG: hypothetical protein QM756_35810 [Polyangiaceae bacterium]